MVYRKYSKEIEVEKAYANAKRGRKNQWGSNETLLSSLQSF